MRKVVSMSALVSGLLAGPLLAGAKPITGDAADPATVAEMRAHIDAVTGGEPLEAERMQDLNQRIVAQVQARIDRARAKIVLAQSLPVSNFQLPLVFVDTDFSPPTRDDAQLLLLDPNGLQVQTEKAAFLGVATSPVNALLRDQLKLQRGMGLVVDYVAPDSPAMQAAMQPHDVLEKLDDQWLVNGPQFAALVRAKKPGDTITLTVIRAGDRLKVTITLAEKELPVLEDQDNFRFSGLPGMSPMPYDGAPNGPAGGPWQHGSRKTIITSPDGTVIRTLKDGTHEITLTTPPPPQGETRLLIKDAAGHQLYEGGYTTDADKAAVPADCAKAVEELAAANPPATGAPASPQQSAATMVRSDAEDQIVLKVDGTEKSLRVKDVKTGKILFDGPVNTDEEVTALPPGIAEKMKWMEQKMGVGK
jgi:PDZ domain